MPRMKIGKVKLKNNFLLAPMANISSAPFRRLCREFGAGLTTSEMISAEALLRGNARTEAMIGRAAGEKPYCLQIFGDDAKQIGRAAEKLEKKCELVDVNLGCPVRKIVDQGAGAALLKKPKLIGEIISELAGSLAVPVTAKMRLGFSSKAGAVEIAKIIEKGGACALTVHGRTVKQGYGGKVDYCAIQEIKNAISIPVIGNGDIFKPEDAERMLAETGCDGVMVGRGAMGNPFIFRQMKGYFAKGEYALPSAAEKAEAFLKFLKYCSGKEQLSNLKVQASLFTKGIEGGAEIRRNIAKAKSPGEVEKVMRELAAAPVR